MQGYVSKPICNRRTRQTLWGGCAHFHLKKQLLTEKNGAGFLNQA